MIIAHTTEPPNVNTKVSKISCNQVFEGSLDCLGKEDTYIYVRAEGGIFNLNTSVYVSCNMDTIVYRYTPLNHVLQVW